MLKQVLILVGAFASVCCKGFHKESECLFVGRFLNDFVKSQDWKPHIIAFLCYKTDILVQITKCLTTSISYQEFNSLNIPNDIQINSILFLTDMSCNQTKNFLENSVQPKYYAKPYRWIIITDKNMENNLPNIEALPDSNLYFVTKSLGWDFVKLHQAYKIEAISDFEIEKFGNWTAETGLSINQTTSIASRRRIDLKRKVMTSSLVITNNDSLAHLEDYKDKHIDTIAKLNYILGLHLLDSVNAIGQYRIVNTWGYLNRTTGFWSGMIRDLVTKDADIGGTSLFFMAYRIKYIDYIAMTASTNSEFIFREPPLSYISNIYTLPFTRNVWIAGGILIFLITLTILITMHVHKKLDQFKDNTCNDDEDENEHYKFTDFVMMAIRAICQMGVLNTTPKSISLSISALILLIATLFLYIFYTANIVALLQSTANSIQTLEDLLKSHLELASDDTPYDKYYLPTATEPIRKAIYEKKMLTKGKQAFIPVNEGIENVRKGFFAFHVELGIGYKLMEDTYAEHEKCNLMSIPFIQVADTWYAIQKNSPYKEILKVNLFKIREHGLQSREFSKLYTKKPICSAVGQNFQSVRLEDCYGAVVILCVGFGLAFALFLLENIFKNKRICLI